MRNPRVFHRPIAFFAIALTVIGGTNYVGVFVAQLISQIVYTTGEQQLIDRFRGFEVILPVSFLVPLIANFIYSLPILRALHRGDFGESAKSRLLRYPLGASVLSTSGWLIGQIPLLTSPVVWAPNNVGYLPWVYIALAVIVAFLVFVIALFVLELIYRRLYYPLFFADDPIPADPNRFRFALGARVIFYFLALIGFPLGVTLLALLRVSRSGSAEGVVLPMAIFIAGAFAVGMLLTLLLTRAVQGPLAAMTRTAREVGGGNYDVAAPVQTHDEIGELGYAMNEMIAGLAERERIRDAFGRAVTPEVRDYLVERGATLGGRELTVSMLFLDVRGFTTLSEGLAPEETLSWLNSIFGVVGEAIVAAGGTIDKYMGDAVMAVFGAPLPQEDHAERAVDAVRRIQAQASELAVDPPLHYGIGLHSGPVLAGTMGTERRMDFTVIGDTVNTASRVEAMCKDLDRRVLMTGDLVEQLGAPAGDLIDLGEHQLRGRNHPVRLYTLP